MTHTEETDLLIEDYIDGRLSGPRLATFEARLKEEPELRQRVQTATQSVEMLRKALAPIEPSLEFEEKVSSQIISITQSNANIHPAGRSRDTKLSANDPDARLLLDPEAEKERRRLMLLAGVAAVIFALAASAVLIAMLQG